MKRRLRGLAVFVLTLALAVVGVGDRGVLATGQDTATTSIKYDVDSGTMTYCVELGANGNPFGAPTSQGTGRIKTSGSSTTVTSETALSSALAPVIARDVIFVQRTSVAIDTAVVTVKTDADTVTVDAAVNWTGQSYTFYKTTCGTTDNDGWVDTSSATRIMMTVQYEQGDLDALQWRFECRQSGIASLPVIVYPSEGDGCGNAGTQTVAGFCEFAAAGAASRFTWEEFGSWARCRIGFRFKTTDTSDAGANLEQVTGSIIVSRGSF